MLRIGSYARTKKVCSAKTDNISALYAMIHRTFTDKVGVAHTLSNKGMFDFQQDLTHCALFIGKGGTCRFQWQAS